MSKHRDVKTLLLVDTSRFKMITHKLCVPSLMEAHTLNKMILYEATINEREYVEFIQQISTMHN